MRLDVTTAGGLIVGDSSLDPPTVTAIACRLSPVACRPSGINDRKGYSIRKSHVLCPMSPPFLCRSEPSSRMSASLRPSISSPAKDGCSAMAARSRTRSTRNCSIPSVPASVAPEIRISTFRICGECSSGALTSTLSRTRTSRAAAQAVNGNAGKTVDAVGSRQSDQFAAHTHDVTASYLFGPDETYVVSGGGSTAVGPASCANTGGSWCRCARCEFS